MQRNLGANAGLDYAGLGALLRCIAGRSLRELAAADAGAADEQRQQAHEQEAAGAAGCGGAFAGGRAYQAFCLQRVARVLRELLADQRRIDGGGGGNGGGGADEAPYHAREAAANAACLHEIEQQLQALGLPTCSGVTQ